MNWAWEHDAARLIAPAKPALPGFARIRTPGIWPNSAAMPVPLLSTTMVSNSSKLWASRAVRQRRRVSPARSVGTTTVTSGSRKLGSYHPAQGVLWRHCSIEGLPSRVVGRWFVRRPVREAPGGGPIMGTTLGREQTRYDGILPVTPAAASSLFWGEGFWGEGAQARNEKRQSACRLSAVSVSTLCI